MSQYKTFKSKIIIKHEGKAKKSYLAKHFNSTTIHYEKNDHNQQ